MGCNLRHWFLDRSWDSRRAAKSRPRCRTPDTADLIHGSRTPVILHSSLEHALTSPDINNLRILWIHCDGADVDQSRRKAGAEVEDVQPERVCVRRLPTRRVYWEQRLPPNASASGPQKDTRGTHRQRANTPRDR